MRTETNAAPERIAAEWLRVVADGDPGIEAQIVKYDGASYMVTTGTGETSQAAFAYEAWEVEQWLGSRRGRERLTYAKNDESEYMNFCDSCSAETNPRIARGIEAESGIRICAPGACEPVVGAVRS